MCQLLLPRELVTGVDKGERTRHLDDPTTYDMAGAVRQPIDEKAFGKFLEENVPIIKTPVDLKQASAALIITRRTVQVDWVHRS